MADKKYKLGGRVYTAESEEEARRQHAEWKAQQSTPEAEEPKRPIATKLVRASADYLDAFTNQTGTTGRKIVKMALPKSLEPSWASSEAIKSNEAKSPDNSAGNFGKFSSDTALGMLIGAGPETLLAKAGLTALPRAGAFLRGAGRVAANAGSGAVQGAVLAPEGEAGTGAAVGGGVAGTLGALGEVGRGTARVLGANRVDPKAARVEKFLQTIDPETKLPNSHRLKPGFLRSVYEGVVSNHPFSGGTMRDQHARAVGTGYRGLVSEITPVNTPLDTVFPRGGTVHDSMAHLNPKSGSGGAYDRALGKFNQEIFDTSGFQIPQGVQEGLDSLHLPSTISDDMTGQQLITLRDDIQRVRDQIIAKKAGGDEKLGRQLVKHYDDARDEILEIMKRKYTSTNAQGNPQMAQDMVDYLDDLKTYKEYDTFKSAVAQTPTGEPGFGAVAMAAQRKSPEAGVMGQAGPLQTIGNDLADVLGDFPSKQGIFQMGASQGMTEGAAKVVIPGTGQGGGLVKAAAAAANPILGSNLVQKKVAEGLSSARALENFFAKYPSFGRFVRSGSISLAQEDE